jgi:hypothetical protein
MFVDVRGACVMKRINLLMLDDELMLVDIACNHYGMTRSEFIRLCCSRMFEYIPFDSIPRLIDYGELFPNSKFFTPVEVV